MSRYTPARPRATARLLTPIVPSFIAERRRRVASPSPPVAFDPPDPPSTSARATNLPHEPFVVDGRPATNGNETPLLTAEQLDHLRRLGGCLQLQMLYCATYRGPATLHTVARWFWGANAQLFALMLQHTKALEEGLLSAEACQEMASVDMCAAGYQPLPAFDALLAAYSNIFVPLVERLTEVPPTRTPPVGVAVQPSAAVVAAATKAWEADAGLGRQVREIVRATPQYSAVWWVAVSMESDSLIVWAGPHRIVGNDSPESRRACVHIAAYDLPRSRWLVDHLGEEAWGQAVAALALPPGYLSSSRNRQGTTSDPIVATHRLKSGTGRWGWRSLYDPEVCVHLLTATMNGGPRTPRPLRPERSSGLHMAAQLGLQSHAILRHAAGPTVANAVETDLLLAVEPLMEAAAPAPWGAVWLALQELTPSSGLQWSDGSPLLIPDRWALVRLLSPAESPTRAALEARGLLPRGLDAVLATETLELYYAPSAYCALARLAEPIADLWLALDADQTRESVQVFFAPQRVGLRSGHVASIPPHIDLPCMRRQHVD